MRIANLQGRAVLVKEENALDIEGASNGKFGSDPTALYEHWDSFKEWASKADWSTAVPFDVADLEAPVPRPRQIFAIGLNYRDHADEGGIPYPENLIVFTKFQSSLAGPNATVTLPSAQVDYETELVVVIGTEAHNVSEAEAWGHVAGLSVGQDFSEREVQLRGPAAQFSLGKSYANFSPFGPAVVTVDEFDDPNALAISAVLHGQGPGAGWTVQDGNTRDLIFSIPRMISDMSQIVTLFPGDVIFTGTPAGVGLSRGIYLQPGNVLTTTIEGIGSLRNAFA